MNTSKLLRGVGIWEDQLLKDAFLIGIKDKFWSRIPRDELFIVTTNNMNVPFSTIAEFKTLNNFLRIIGKRSVFIFDIPDDYCSTAHDEVKALLELPQMLRDFDLCNIGILVLIKRDVLKKVITQNLAQFEALYQEYRLP